MKHLLLAIFLMMIGLSGVAWVITPSPDTSGRQTIIWASDDNPRRRLQVETFNRLQSRYELQLDAVNNGLDKVITQSLAGVGPDVFDAFRPQIALLAEAGLLHDVTDELAQRGITLDQFPPLAQGCMAINGRVYGVACNVVGDGMWYHKDLFRQAGLALPPDSGWTWGEFLAAAQKLVERDSAGRIVRFGVMGLSWYDVVLSNGGRLLSPDGRRCVVDSPQAIDAVSRWIDLQEKYRVMPRRTDEASMSTQGGWNTGIMTLFREKRVAMAPGGRWWLCMIRDAKDRNGQFPLDLGVTEKPILKLRRFTGAARVAFVNALSPNRQRAVDFLAYLTSVEYCDQINRDADGVPGPLWAWDREAYAYDPNGGRDGGASPAWKSISRLGVNGELSPYVTTKQVEDIINKQIDLLCAGLKTPEQALKQAAADINAEIQRNVLRDPELTRRYDSGDTAPVYDNFPDQEVAPTTAGP